MAVLYNILVKFIVSVFLKKIYFYYYWFFLFPGISSRYMTGDYKFYIYTWKWLLYKQKMS